MPITASSRRVTTTMSYTNRDLHLQPRRRWVFPSHIGEESTPQQVRVLPALRKEGRINVQPRGLSCSSHMTHFPQGIPSSFPSECPNLPQLYKPSSQISTLISHLPTVSYLTSRASPSFHLLKPKCKHLFQPHSSLTLTSNSYPNLLHWIN
jgi:hypothetical protein